MWKEGVVVHEMEEAKVSLLCIEEDVLLIAIEIVDKVDGLRGGQF